MQAAVSSHYQAGVFFIIAALSAGFFLSAPSIAGEIEPFIFFVDPPAANSGIPSIAIRGGGWGAYATRVNPRVWLLDPQEADKKTELIIEKNYRDFEPDELFLRVAFIDEIKNFQPGNYLIYIRTESGQEATAPFSLAERVDLSTEKRPTLVIQPTSGSIGTYILLTAGGFSPRTTLTLRLDGHVMTTSPLTDEKGMFENIGLVFPSFITKRDHSIVPMKPGKHTIEVFDHAKAGASTSETFSLDVPPEEKKDFNKEQKELVEMKRKEEEQRKKDEKEKEQKDRELKKALENEKKLKKEEERIERQRKELEEKDELTKKEEKRLKELRKEEQRKERQLESAETFADQLRKERQRLQHVLQEESFLGKPCRADKGLTFQSGCIAPQPMAIEKPYAGKPCDADIPLVWQEGCRASEKREQKTVFYGKACDPGLPKIWQEGCGMEAEPGAGKCNALLPNYSQKGCIP